MFKNWFYFLSSYFIFVKKKITEFLNFIIALKNLILNEIFFDSNDREPFREVLRTFITYVKVKFNLRIFFNTILTKQFGDSIFFRNLFLIFSHFLKYLLVLYFILWIFFESLFFRFYLVDTPFDTKMDQSRKEGGKEKRFIPIIGFEALSFYSRPFWRIFNNLVVFASNFISIFFLIYYVFVLDFFYLFKNIIQILIKFFIFFVGLITYLLFFIFFRIKEFFFVLLLMGWRLYFYTRCFFLIFNYIFFLPFLLGFNLLHAVLFAYKKIKFAFFILNESEIKNLVFNIKFSSTFFKKKISDMGFEVCFVLESFVVYLTIKYFIFDILTRHKNKTRFFILSFKYKGLIKFITICFHFLKFFYLLFCYFVACCLCLFVFLNFIYFPFILL